MVFSSTVFLFYFLPAVLLIYYIVPRRLRNGVIFLSSLVFYFWGERLLTAIMLLSTVIDYSHGLIVDKFKRAGKLKLARTAVASSIIFNLAILFFFKYWDFIAGALQSIGVGVMPKLGISLPIGISFYTFQTMSYTVDVYRGDARAQRSILRFGTFVTLFPQLIAGPIIKYKDLGDQIDQRELTVDRFSAGVTRFTAGLAKKLLIANNLGQLWDACKTMPEGLSVVGAWLGILAFAFQIYFDFSGYSDMAIGLGRMLGFEFPENFNYPYVSKSITEFWRRWHISLSSWFRDYLYIPLGGNRKGKARWVINLLIVWAATGIWHGASFNFLLWGLYFFALLAIEKLFLGKLLEKLPGVFGHIYTVFFVLIGWVIFAVEDVSGLGAYLSLMFGAGGAPLVDPASVYRLLSFLPMLIIAGVGSLPVVSGLYAKIPKRLAGPATVLLVLAGLVICTAYMIAGTYDPFLYFRF